MGAYWRLDRARDEENVKDMALGIREGIFGWMKIDVKKKKKKSETRREIVLSFYTIMLGLCGPGCVSPVPCVGCIWNTLHDVRGREADHAEDAEDDDVRGLIPSPFALFVTVFLHNAHSL
jgi:hypothetical protein